MSKMSKAPVYYAMAQAHFSPIAFEKYASQFHDAVRAKFPSRKEITIRRLELAARAGVSADAKINDSVLWLMTASNSRSGLVLNDSTLTFHTTSYDTKSPFISELLDALEALHLVAKLDHISRLGMRYLDAVIPEAGRTVSDYLVDSVRGVNFSANRTQSLSESIFETQCGPIVESGTLVSRVYQLQSALGYPPDLLPVMELAPAPRFSSTEKVAHAIIDTDHFVEDIMAIDFPQIRAQVESLHKACSDVFGALTTPYAKDCWK